MTVQDMLLLQWSSYVDDDDDNDTEAGCEKQ
jgi:hypothetical protein